MSSKALFIMSTGENEKALTGLTFAYFSKVQGWFDDVKVVFRSTEHGTIAHVAGFSSDVEVVEAMYHSLHSQAATHMATIRRGTAPPTRRSPR